MKICIDPGHGGKDSGAVGNGLLEKNINLAVAIKLKKKLETAGVTVIMTRVDDTYLDLTTRSKIANNAKVDYFLSIHHNSGGGHGYDVIYALCGGKSKTVANAIATQFDAIGQKQHGVYSKAGSDGRDYYAVIRQTNMAANICEYGFIDTDDVNHFNTDALQEVEAEAIFKGLCIGLGITIPQPAPIPQPVQQVQPIIEKKPVGYDEYLPGRRIIHLDAYTYISIEDGNITLYAKGKQSKQLI